MPINSIQNISTSLDNLPLALTYIDDAILALGLVIKPLWSWKDVKGTPRKKPGPAPVLLEVRRAETKRPDMVRARAAAKALPVIVLPDEKEALDQVRWEELRWGYKDEPGTF